MIFKLLLVQFVIINAYLVLDRPVIALPAQIQIE